MNEIVFACLIVWAALAVPSMAHGMVLAKRAGGSLGLAVIVCLLLPWLGLLFFLNQPPGTKRVVGLGYYCSSMFVVVSTLALWSIFLPWVTGDPALLGGDGAHGPLDALPLAVIAGVWALCLIAGSIGITRGGDMVVGVVLGIVVALAFGMLLALVNLWGRAGLLVPELRDAQAEIENRVAVGPGGWVAFVALVVAYICITLLPFGLRLVPHTMPPMDPMPGQPAMPQPTPGAPMPGQPIPGQPWPGQPPSGQQWPPQPPSRTGAGW